MCAQCDWRCLRTHEPEPLLETLLLPSLFTVVMRPTSGEVVPGRQPKTVSMCISAFTCARNTFLLQEGQ